MTRRRFVAGAAGAGLLLAAGGMTSLAGIAATPEPALAIPAGFSPFDASSPWAKPSFLVCEEDWYGAEPDRVENHGSSITYTSGGTYWDDDIFLQVGRPYWVIGMEHSWNWFAAEWASVGHYHGRRVGCRMTVSDPVHVDNYNGWGRPSGWDGEKLEERYGARHFFVLAQTFCSALSHWMCGLAHIKQRFEFFYTDDPSRAAIDIDWAYYKCNSVQRDGGGSEWVSPGSGWQGHAFIPRGVDSTAYWTTGLFWGWNVVSTWEGGVNERCSFMLDYSGTAIEYHRGDTAGWDGYTWSFAPYDAFHRVGLEKRSSNPGISGATGAYSLAGAVYGVYLDGACTVEVGSLTTDESGGADLEAINGTPYLIADTRYYVKELLAPPGYLLDTEVHEVYLDGDKVISLPEVPRTCIVRFYVDGGTAPIWTDEVPLGWRYTSRELGYVTATNRAAKPDCTPGLDAWYADRSLTKHFEGAALDGDLDLYARNVATVAYAPTAGSALSEDLPLRGEMDDASPLLDVSKDVMPPSRAANWGSRIALKDPLLKTMHYHDGERWRTLRWVEGGWFATEAGVGKRMTTLSVDRDTTIYGEFSRSTYDGILSW